MQTTKEIDDRYLQDRAAIDAEFRAARKRGGFDPRIAVTAHGDATDRLRAKWLEERAKI
jgi:hypothetical protein